MSRIISGLLLTMEEAVTLTMKKPSSAFTALERNKYGAPVLTRQDIPDMRQQPRSDGNRYAYHLAPREPLKQNKNSKQHDNKAFMARASHFAHQRAYLAKEKQNKQGNKPGRDKDKNVDTQNATTAHKTRYDIVGIESDARSSSPASTALYVTATCFEFSDVSKAEK